MTDTPLTFCKQFSNPDLPGYVGFANLPNQVHRKSVKKGFEFTLMVVGESGILPIIDICIFFLIIALLKGRARMKIGRGLYVSQSTIHG